MHTKKSEKADVDRRTGLFRLVGLAFSLLLVAGMLHINLAFEMADPPVVEEEGVEIVFMPPSTRMAAPKPKIPQPKPKPQPKVVDVTRIKAVMEPVVNTVQQPEELTLEDISEFDDLFRTNRSSDPEEYWRLDQAPQFIGGDAALAAFLQKHLVYPELCKEHGIEGRVEVEFVINYSGKVSDVKVYSGAQKLLDREATRVVRKMPKWRPGFNQGAPVACRYRIPIVFKLH